jgi:hypothetical protein
VTQANEMHAGGCLCGGVRYRIEGALRGVIACHCRQCARTSGHHVAMTSVRRANLALISSETLSWYKSSPGAERGFCRVCGGNLFWRQSGEDTISIAAGTLDTPTNLALTEHIFVADKSDHYQLNDDLPKKAQWS